MKSVGENLPNKEQVSRGEDVLGMEPHEIRTPAGDDVSGFLGKELAAAPTIARLRRRLELPQAIRSERVAFGERAYERFWPVFLDAAMLILASLLARVVSIVADNPLSPVVWDSFFYVLVICGFGLRGLYRHRIRPNLLDEVRARTDKAHITFYNVKKLR